MEGVWVGRRAQLDALRGCWSSALDGRSQTVLVLGGRGSGRTTLVERALDEVVVPCVLRTAGDEVDQDLPGAAVEALLAVSLDDAGATAAWWGRLLVERIRDLGRPSAIVLDDASRADDVSLQAMAFARRRLAGAPVMFVVVADALDDVPSGLADAARRDTGATVELGPLEPADVRALAAALGVGPLADHTVERLLSATSGRPGALRAVLELDGQELRDPRDEPLRVPGLVARSPLDADLSSAARAALEAAAVLDDDALVPTVLALAGIDPDSPRAGAVLDELTTTPGVVFGERPAGPTVHFAHVAAHAEAYHSIRSSRRAALHRRAADLFDDERRVVHHLARSTVGHDDALAERAAALAAERTATGGWLAAAGWHLTAVRLRSSVADRDRDLLLAAEALLVCGDLAAAAELVDDVEVGEPAWIELLLGRIDSLRGDARGEERLRSAWAASGPGDDRVASLAASHLAAVAFARGNGEDAVEWARRALERSTQDAAGRDVDPTSRLLLSQGLAGQVHAGLDEARRRGLLEPGGTRSAEGEGRFGAAALLLTAGDLERSSAMLDEVAERAGRSGPHHLWCYAQAWRSFAAVRRGRWDEALVHAEDAASAADIEAQAFAALGRFATAFVRVGRGDDATAVMAEAAEATRAAGSTCLLQQWLAALHAWRAEVDGDHDGVVDALVPWDPRTLTRAVRPLLPSAATMQVRALARLDRLDEARTLLARLDDPVSPAERAWHHAAAAELAWAGGDVRDLQRSLELATSTLPGGTEHLDRARVLLLAGSLLRRAGKRRRAAGLLQAARHVFARLGARPFVERCDAELASGGRGTTRDGGAGDALTPAERAVVDLVVAGRTNREVAAELHLSPKTVEHHLGSAFRKVGVSNRTELAARLAEPQPSAD